MFKRLSPLGRKPIDLAISLTPLYSILVLLLKTIYIEILKKYQINSLKMIMLIK